jgi:hypothetical protein
MPSATWRFTRELSPRGVELRVEGLLEEGDQGSQHGRASQDFEKDCEEAG